jgi:uncharacterized membrane protein YciS (DUF1049 family)
MSAENNAEHSYRISYLVCGIFLVGFILVTWAVVSNAHHRTELEQIVGIPTATPSP